MVDYVSVTPGTGENVAADEIGGLKYQRAKLVWGPDGTANDASAANPLPIVIDSSQIGDIGPQAKAASVSVTVATDEDDIGVKTAVQYVTVDMTTLTTALTTGAVVAATQVVAACTPGNDLPALLQSLVVIDPDDQGAELNVVLFSANTTLGTEGSAPDIDDTEVQTVIGIVNVATTDYKDLGLSKVATLRNIGLPVLPATGTDDIYVGVFGVGTPTFAGGHLYLRMGFI